MNFIVIIPARFASNRLPGKPLININGKPMIIRTMEQAQKSGASRIIVATDHVNIMNTVKLFGGEVCITHINHQSGTERIKEVIDYYKFNDNQIIVNLQVDEPFIPPEMIQYVVNDLIEVVDTNMSTLSVPIYTRKEMFNPNIVKVVVNTYGYALYFSRSNIPRNAKGFKCNKKYYMQYISRHIGIYAYRVSFIQRYINWVSSPLEKIEMLEQLRVLWHGGKIHVSKVNIPSSISIDTQEALKEACTI